MKVKPELLLRFFIKGGGIQIEDEFFSMDEDNDLCVKRHSYRNYNKSDKDERIIYLKYECALSQLFVLAKKIKWDDWVIATANMVLKERK